MFLCNLRGVGDGTCCRWWVIMQVLRISSQIFICFESTCCSCLLMNIIVEVTWTTQWPAWFPTGLPQLKVMFCPTCKYVLDQLQISIFFLTEEDCIIFALLVVVIVHGRRQHFFFYFLYFVSSSLLTPTPTPLPPSLEDLSSFKIQIQKFPVFALYILKFWAYPCLVSILLMDWGYLSTGLMLISCHSVFPVNLEACFQPLSFLLVKFWGDVQTFVSPKSFAFPMTSSSLPIFLQ